ncbi:MAG TPA: alanine racemase [Anaerolineae bacterium]|nr:alanine racemase [Anaerolineae bacterium]
MNKYDLDTPALVIDWDTMQNNINVMQKVADDAGVKLRPHTKTHKTPLISHLQLKAGAQGITVAKLGEAEVMEAGGIDDILVAFPLQGASKLERLLHLAERATITVSLDSRKVAQDISDAAQTRGTKIPVYIEVDVGLGRVGAAHHEGARDLVREIVELPGIDFLGIMTHAGHTYKAKTLEEIQQLGREEGEWMVETAELIRKDGIEVRQVSVGSTPTARFSAKVNGVTEIRPGTYVFYDTTQVMKHACTWDDCAMTILATVVVKHPDRLVFDAGSKTLSSDTAPNGLFGTVKGYPHLEIWRLNEEHATVRIAGDGPLPNIGDKVEIIPNHACATMNLHDSFTAVSKDEVIGEFKIQARGKIR